MGRLLVLASASPRRRELLRGLKRRFEVRVSDVHERTRQKDPRRLVELLALRKALAVARERPEALVLGADTVVVCRGVILGKPKDERDALRMLEWQNGHWQSVLTGVALVADGGRLRWVKAAVSKVKARRLSEEELSRFARKHLDKAGAYAVQDKKDPFIERVSGDFDNVVGLPMRVVKTLVARADKELAGLAPGISKLTSAGARERSERAARRRRP